MQESGNVKKPVALSDLRVSSIPVAECHEKLVDIVGIHKNIFVDDSLDNHSHLEYTPVFKVRESVAERLTRAANLLPDDYGFIIKESFRPVSMQKFYFNRRLKRLAAEYLTLSHEELVRLTSEFVAPPNVAGHPTGGAIDLLLCLSGKICDMGSEYDMDIASSNGKCMSFCENISEKAQKNRNIMFSVLSANGFVNYPFEWWHWSYGDKYWAAMTNAQFALYDYVK
ncbi:M15 family metallopeptidase [Dickeya chrysanthemi]|uniref:D-alanyl-D-alanine dipeptidase n=1 Tax=Dickeya chrysanthemi TaxID=556 RepID=A0ABU8JMJ2_DICCH|nr:M15 family metallopeptidase [Dickeya chrysanthemi]MBX9447225.1 M15 family metallopeptidase [Dickeya chrysanthemi]